MTSERRKGIVNRNLLLATVAVGLFGAACGTTTTAASPSPSPGLGRGAQFRNGASGQLVQINGQTLILTAATGDVTVTFSTSTTFTRTSTAVLADIVPGQCMVAAGQKDSAGVLTATTVRLSPKTAAGCTAGGFGPNASPGASPRPSLSPRPTPSGVPAAFVTGEVTAASGTSITVLTTASGSQTITVPTTAAVSKSAVVSSTDLQTGECVRANGSKDASGAIQATAITITPPGPSGTCTTGLGGRGPGRVGASPGAAAPNG
jgi:hypothetical protein